MWYILISICFVLRNLCSSLPMITNNEFHHYRHIRSLQSTDNRDSASSSNSCSIQSINIDTTVPETNTSLAMNIIQFMSSWKQTIITDDEDSTSLNIIEVNFTIPYQISNESIINKTIFITDIKHHRLLATLTKICINSSSFIVNYSINKWLPHNICLYLLLNLTVSTQKEIIFCRTIDDFNNSKLHDTSTATTGTGGPSGYFILSQCVIIILMMFIIYAVETARKKSLVNRVSQRLHRSRPYISIFGIKTITRTGSNAINTSINPATTLQVGLNQLVLDRNLASIATPIEEQVLAANDLTSTIYDRRASRPSLNRDLIDIKEFTKRISFPNDTITDTEL